jgi:hypothetical protein
LRRRSPTHDESIRDPSPAARRPLASRRRRRSRAEGRLLREPRLRTRRSRAQGLRSEDGNQGRSRRGRRGQQDRRFGESHRRRRRRDEGRRLLEQRGGAGRPPREAGALGAVRFAERRGDSRGLQGSFGPLDGLRRARPGDHLQHEACDRGRRAEDHGRPRGSEVQRQDRDGEASDRIDAHARRRDGGATRLSRRRGLPPAPSRQRRGVDQRERIRDEARGRGGAAVRAYGHGRRVGVAGAGGRDAAFHPRSRAGRERGVPLPEHGDDPQGDEAAGGGARARRLSPFAGGRRGARVRSRGADPSTPRDEAASARSGPRGDQSGGGRLGEGRGRNRGAVRRARNALRAEVDRQLRGLLRLRKKATPDPA